MRLASLNSVEPGTILGKTIYAQDGRPLLKEGTELTSNFIRRLIASGYYTIYIEDELTYDVEVEDLIPEPMRQKAITEVKNAFKSVTQSKGIDRLLPQETSKNISEIMNSLLDEMRGSELFNINMGTIMGKDESLYTHCFNVGVYSTIIAIAAGFDEKLVREIGIGALLHDIGKTLIPSSILNKPGKLTPEEWEEIKKHPQMGYDIIRKQIGFSAISAHCAYQHHEKYDGTGYPRGLKGDEIHVVGRVIAVADVFDAITAVRPYKRPILPSEALEMIYVDTGTHFDHQFVTLFRDNIALYPVGVTVRLSNGNIGVVVKQSKSLQLPVVRVYIQNGVQVPPYDIDLSSTNGVTVTELFLENDVATHTA